MAEIPTDGEGATHSEDRAHALRLASEQSIKAVVPDPDVKAMLEEMNRRYRVNRERLTSNDDGPDAA
jgi:hypothetical protein